MCAWLFVVFSMSVGDAGSAGASFSGPTSLALVSGIFPSLSGDDGGSGDQLPEFAEDVDPAHRCCSCGEVLRQPRQTPCGHRICTPCLAKFDSTESFRCPADEEGCLEMTINDVSNVTCCAAAAAQC